MLTQKIFPLLLMLILLPFALYAMPEKNLFPEIDDSKGIIDFEFEENKITYPDIERARFSSSGWTATSRGGILSALGFFNVGDTVVVRDKSNTYVGKYIVYAESTYSDKERDTTYKLLKPIHKKFSAPRTVPLGFNVQKKFNFNIEPSYTFLYSKTTGMTHMADIALSSYKIAYPITITLGPFFGLKQYDSNMILGGFVGANYTLPLDFMANTVTNLHFLFDFKCLLGTTLTLKSAFYYGASFNAGLKWYPWSFMSLKLQFSLSSLYSADDFSTIFKGYGASFGVGFEI